MTTIRTVRDDIQNILDFLVDAELALYASPVRMSGSRVTFQTTGSTSPFLNSRGPGSVEQYIDWVASGAYSAILFDASLLQMTVDVEGGAIVGHRLAHIPCPWSIDPALLRFGDSVVDVLALYTEASPVLRSPIRFDFDPNSARSGHPAAHLTVNEVSCRIACVAPMHVLRFVDFVFQNFYPAFWRAHEAFFAPAIRRHAGERSASHDERTGTHVAWDVYT